MQAVVPTFKEKTVAQKNRTRTVHVQVNQGSQRVRVPTNVVNVYFENGYFITGWQGSHEFEIYTSIPEGTEVEIEFSGKQTSTPGPFGEDVSYRMIGVKTIRFNDVVADFTSPVVNASKTYNVEELNKLLAHTKNGNLLSPATVDNIISQLIEKM